MLDVVEGEDFVEEHQAGVGHPEIVFGERGEAFDLADDVVGEEADGSGGEGREPGNAGGLVAVEGVFEQGEDVAFKGCCLAGFGDLDRFSPRDDFFVWADADEGVAAYAFAALDGLEHEAFRFACGETEEGGDWGFEVGCEAAVDGDEGVSGGESLEVFACG